MHRIRWADADATGSPVDLNSRRRRARARAVEPLQGLEALVDLAEGDLDGSQAVVHAAEVVADIGIVGGEVGRKSGNLHKGFFTRSSADTMAPPSNRRASAGGS